MSDPIVLSAGPRTKVHIYADPSALARAAVEEFVHCASDALHERERFNVALSGGSTPRRIYELIATEHAEALEWERVHLFFGDERHVPPDDAQSNYRMVRETLLANPRVQPVVHRIESERKADEAAAHYEAEVRKHFHISEKSQPQFDLILLGMGTDGHTASLFPGTAALNESVGIVVANSVPQLKTDRITLTFPAINHARRAIFLTAGMDKASMVKKVLCGTDGPAAYPSQRIHPLSGELVWMLDTAAASELDLKSGSLPTS